MIVGPIETAQANDVAPTEDKTRFVRRLSAALESHNKACKHANENEDYETACVYANTLVTQLSIAHSEAVKFRNVLVGRLPDPVRDRVNAELGNEEL